MKSNLKILAIETSCDETAAAVIGEETIFGSQTKSGMTGFRPIILSNIISSQIDLHAKTGGVVPEVASREHMKSIVPVISIALIESVGDQFLISNSEFLNKSRVPNPNSKNNTAIQQYSNEEYQNAIKILQNEITHVAVTNGPGLIGSLLVGFSAAKTIAYASGKPIIPINHIEGHIYSAFNCHSCEGRNLDSGSQAPVRNDRTNFPILALTVSGGHTSLTLMKDHGVYEQIGATLDDAVGEAYDKVAKLLGFSYPGGPVISKYATRFRTKFLISNSKFPPKGSLRLNESQFPISQNKYSNIAMKQYNNKEMPLGISFPRPIIDDGTFNFSFSGLKTAVLVWVKKYLEANKLNSVDGISLEVKEEIAAAFEEAVKDVLAAKTVKAALKYKPRAVIFAGGVSANEYLRSQIESAVNCQLSTVNFFVPDKELTGDNAAMIGLAAYYHIKRGDVRSWDEISVDSNLEL